MRLRGLLSIWLLLFGGAAQLSAQGCPDPVLVVGDMPGPLAHVRYLADDALQGRLGGSAGERCAGDYIAAQFQALGLKPAGEGGSFFQELPLASVVNPHAPGGTGRNVAALLEGADPAVRDQMIIIGAHYDHLGMGEFGSTAPDQKGAVHNGADDNASGVAAMLEAARLLSSGSRPARSVLFVAFTGEESGLLGSAYFTKHPTVPIANARAMINLDMVGRLGSQSLVVYGADTAREWRQVLERLAAELSIKVGFIGDGYGPSDQTSFYVMDIPVVHFFTNTHAQYHSPADDWQLVDSAGLGRIALLSAQLAREVADQRVQVTLVRGAGQKPGAAPGGGYGAWLGSVPDFSPIERGVLLGGVSAGSPAEKAGLAKGDVIVRIGGAEIADLQAMTDVLRQHQPGDTVEVVILRANAERKLTVTLGSRANR
ncbi:MAG: M20/M25/M40 family metallo-hydrolase [Gemmatimonadetes bacterium]|nr:M20/M25/M40 family metallo-hydrolase [Gemmatimonadota bacterium]